jgi:hypothetical protein
VYTLHVVKEVVASGKPIARQRPLTICISAKMGFRTMSMHSMCFPFMSKEACSGGELNSYARLDLASEWSQVGVDIFADA